MLRRSHTSVTVFALASRVCVFVGRLEVQATAAGSSSASKARDLPHDLYPEHAEDSEDAPRSGEADVHVDPSSFPARGTIFSGDGRGGISSTKGSDRDRVSEGQGSAAFLEEATTFWKMQRQQVQADAAQQAMQAQQQIQQQQLGLQSTQELHSQLHQQASAQKAALGTGTARGAAGEEDNGSSSSSGKVDRKRTNVLGDDLALCSHDGEAMTGFTRDGNCVEKQDDAGSHHICLNLNSAKGGGKSFCALSGQDEWCAQPDVCMTDGGEDTTGKKCARKNWCVCQHRFQNLLENDESICQKLEIHMDATNMYTLVEYCKDAESQKSFAKALKCLKEHSADVHCGSDALKEFLGGKKKASGTRAAPSLLMLLLLLFGWFISH